MIRREESGDWGRDYGWSVENDGVEVVVLGGARCVDQFWYEYKLEAVDGVGLSLEVFEADFWETPGLIFRNRKTGDAVRDILVSSDGIPSREHPYVLTRALHLRPRPGAVRRLLGLLRSLRRSPTQDS